MHRARRCWLTAAGNEHSTTRFRYPAAASSSRSRMPAPNHQASQGPTRCPGMASYCRSADPGCRARRADDAGADRRHASLERRQARSGDHSTAQARQALQDRQMTVFVYVNTSKQGRRPDHLKVFANEDAAQRWFRENDPEGVALRSRITSRIFFIVFWRKRRMVLRIKPFREPIFVKAIEGIRSAGHG